jgi:putative phage-type endonuclease
VNIIPDLEQGTAEWLAMRKGKPTASRFAEIITAAKGELSKSSAGYIRELIGECFVPGFEYFSGNRFTEWGNEHEPEARAAFQAETGLDVRKVGFVLAKDGVCGCSPDGLIYQGGDYVAGLEIKCPTPKVHIGYVLDGGLPDDYKQQVHGSMAITGLREWHFWSYFPGMRHHHHVVRWDAYTEKLVETVASFVESYRQAYAQAAPRLSLEYRTGGAQ